MSLANVPFYFGNNWTVAGNNSIQINGYFDNYGNSHTVTNSVSGGSLTLAGVVGLSNTSTAAGTLTFSGAGTTVISGTVANYVPGQGSGAGTASNLNYAGTGQLILAGVSTYTGTTGVTGGTLQFAGASSLPTTAVTVGNGATVDLGGSHNTTGLVTLSNGGTLQNGTLTSNNAGEAANNHFTGTITLGAGGAFVTNQRLLLGNTGTRLADGRAGQRLDDLRRRNNATRTTSGSAAAPPR